MYEGLLPASNSLLNITENMPENINIKNLPVPMTALCGYLQPCTIITCHRQTNTSELSPCKDFY